MNKSSDYVGDPLDRLLAQPSQMADRGFSQRIQNRLRDSEKLKIAVFSTAFSLWLLLSAIVTTPAQLLQQFHLVSGFMTQMIQTLHETAFSQEPAIHAPEFSGITLVLVLGGCLIAYAFGNLLRD